MILFLSELWNLKLNGCNLEYIYAVRLGHCQGSTERTRWSKTEICSGWGIYCYNNFELTISLKIYLNWVKSSFLSIQGDHVTFLNVYKGFIESKRPQQWCYKNFLNYQSMVCIITEMAISPCFPLPIFLFFWFPFTEKSDWNQGSTQTDCSEIRHHFEIMWRRYGGKKLYHLASIEKGLQVFNFTLFQAVRKAVTAGFFANACRLEVSDLFYLSVSSHPFR